jgi:hypothetical protein
MSPAANPVPPINELHGFDGLRFHPVKLLKIVNALIAQGPDQSWRLLEAYCHESVGPARSPENALVVALALCVNDANEPLPRVQMGAPDIDEPADARLFPAWPLHVEGQLPLMLVGGYMLAGQTLPVALQLEWFKTHARVRRSRIVPEDQPFALADRFLRSDRWRHLQSKPWHEEMLRLQAWRAVDTVVPLEPQDEQRVLSGSLDRWREVRDAVESRRLIWDAEANEYRRE